MRSEIFNQYFSHNDKEDQFNDLEQSDEDLIKGFYVMEEDSIFNVPP